MWGVKNPEELICMEEFNAMVSGMKNFHFIPVVSNSNTWKGEKGRIDSERIKRILELYRFDMGSCGYYVCGPPLMAKSVILGLKNIGINNGKIHYERFSM